MADASPTRRIPALVLTGFLGSGKTTLLNRLMQARPAALGKLAIIVNELGAVGIDGDLLPKGMTRQVELPGGCICCVLNEELDKTILELLDGTPDIAMIVIETTGIAEPMPICWSLEREPLSDRVRLVAVLTVVDVTNFEQSRGLSPGVDAQIEYADILAASKTDLLPGGNVPEALLATLRALNPDAPLVTGTADEVVALLWRMMTDPEPVPASAARRAAGNHDHDHGAGAHEDEDEDKHGDEGPVLSSVHGFESIWLPIEGELDFEELSAQLEQLPGNWVRIKGIARVVDESTGDAAPRWVAFHRVGTRVSCEPLAAPASPRVVALGKELDRARLAACLDASVIPSEP
jgi:G3E family GTPase